MTDQKCPICSQWIIDPYINKIPCPECGKTVQQWYEIIRDKERQAALDELTAQEQEIGHRIQTIKNLCNKKIGIDDATILNFLKSWEEFWDRESKMTEQEMGLYDDPKTMEQAERVWNSWPRKWISKEEAKEIYPDFPFGPIPHWIKCSDELPPNDLHKEILIFNRYKETANGPLFERTFVWQANTFKHNSGCLSLNHFYTWWMKIPEPPNE